MSWPASFFFPHQVQVRDVDGGAGMGSSFSDPRAIAAEVKDEQRLVRAADGSEVVSSTTVTVPLAESVAPGALVTVWAGTSAEREASVLAVAREENSPPLPSHLILSLE